MAQVPLPTIVTSPAPTGVAITIYRAPDRPASQAIEAGWLGGYALVTETRTIAIPAGEAAIRFEGVAGGIVPESAIVAGLPDGVVEKNQDADLLSPASLLDRSLGKRVSLRRTSRATGAVRVEEAVVRTGAGGGVIVQTASGVEALRCSGLPETIVYDQVPAGLSARPTLSVTTVARAAATATVTLSYIATGFDWQADYVGTLSPDGRSLALFAWVTLANGDETSFRNAGTQVVAGRLAKERDQRPERADGSLRLLCWPQGTTTSDLPFFDGAAPPPPPPPAVEMAYAVPVSVIDEQIVVTGSRIARRAVQEELGDLKLYRIPDPVTVAAMSQKQVALLDRPRVAVTQVYRRRVYGARTAFEPATRVFVTRNRTAEGLGLPLPAGRVALFASTNAGSRTRPILVGEGSLDDRAIGEDVEIAVGPAPGVLSRVTASGEEGRDREFLLEVTNDRPYAIAFEAEFEEETVGVGADADTVLLRRDGRPLWRATVPANGRAAFRYQLKP